MYQTLQESRYKQLPYSLGLHMRSSQHILHSLMYRHSLLAIIPNKLQEGPLCPRLRIPGKKKTSHMHSSSYLKPEGATPNPSSSHFSLLGSQPRIFRSAQPSLRCIFKLHLHSEILRQKSPSSIIRETYNLSTRPSTLKP